jgi:O-phospho-L-seryl-tRNASec:L-selenocysteinyl-tRNA synthase
MVPVGGAVVTSPLKGYVDAVGKTYAGRASASPIVDLFITLLSMGQNGYRQLLETRKELFEYMRSKLEEFATTHNERVLKTPHNPISLAMTIDSHVEDPTLLGSMLFTRCSSGLRVVVPRNSTKQIGTLRFDSYGAHLNHYPHSYLTMACAVGQTKEEIDKFFVRFEKTLKEYRKEVAKIKNGK